MRVLISVLGLLFSLLSTTVVAGTETGLKIISIGANAQGSRTFYFKVDRTIGPYGCRSDLVKVDLYNDYDSQAEVISNNIVRSMVLSAFVANSNVQLKVRETCLHSNPTISQIWLSK
ncbi:hypothetical protein [Endozoicomonas sp. GU-1]|uniref:hypothetical protein n=1 Tax=Endozoicomonas sp. GU-1 TaxID=3009078 RepID=UPI0022B5836F|nr:hypothetical protein [Endozoicomonas sp. GU-1]WBA83325.1 hypothetical protein O2T12_09480 [Endozoicomonas sp. GU-1]WBA86255.1 hypothetical protein O3276_24140 [Endozoicomonas sp. GU-1]